MTNPGEALARTVEVLADDRGWNQAEIHRRSKVAISTLNRIAVGNGARPDTLAKLDAAFELPTGTLAAVLRGETDAEAVRALHRGRVDAGGRRTLGESGDEVVSTGVRELMERLADQEETIRRVLANKLRTAGIRPLWPAPDEPNYDLAYETDDGVLHVIEVKVAGDSSDNVYAGMGQLIAYMDRLEGRNVRPVLVLERAPTDEERRLVEKRGVDVASLDDWSVVTNSGGAGTEH